MSDQDRTGGCFCGSVRYVARGAYINARVCHCRLCQKVIGAAFNARLLYPRDRVEMRGEVAEHPTSAAINRGFCPHCGTTVYSHRTATGVIGLTTGSLDDPASFRPDAHVFVADRQPWVTIPDDVAAYPGAAPA